MESGSKWYAAAAAAADATVEALLGTLEAAAIAEDTAQSPNDVATLLFRPAAAAAEADDRAVKELVGVATAVPSSGEVDKLVTD